MDTRNEYRIVGDILGNYEAQFRRPRKFPWRLFGEFGAWHECSETMGGGGTNSSKSIEKAEEIAKRHAEIEFNRNRAIKSLGRLP